MNNLKRIGKKIIAFAAWTALGYALCMSLRQSAVAFRGNASWGGEIMLLGMPLYIVPIRAVIRDIRSGEFKKLLSEIEWEG